MRGKTKMHSKATNVTPSRSDWGTAADWHIRSSSRAAITNTHSVHGYQDSYNTYRTIAIDWREGLHGEQISRDDLVVFVHADKEVLRRNIKSTHIRTQVDKKTSQLSQWRWLHYYKQKQCVCARKKDWRCRKRGVLVLFEHVEVNIVNSK